MTRATRVAIVSLLFTTIYLLAFFQVLSLPLVDDEIAQQILPVVSGLFPSWDEVLNVTTDSMVDPCLIRFICFMVPRLGTFHVQRLS